MLLCYVLYYQVLYRFEKKQLQPMRLLSTSLKKTVATHAIALIFLKKFNLYQLLYHYVLDLEQVKFLFYAP